MGALGNLAEEKYPSDGIERVLSERVVRVKLWTAEGRVVYSDEQRLIGTGGPLEFSVGSGVTVRTVTPSGA